MYDCIRLYFLVVLLSFGWGWVVVRGCLSLCYTFLNIRYVHFLTNFFSTLHSIANNPLAELDDILNGIKDVVEGESRSTSPVPPSNAAASTTTAAAAASTTTAKPKTSGTSTLKAGVGYETGAYTTSTTTLNKHMSDAATKQGKVDDASQLLIDRLATFVQEYNGSEGMVLLALKMSPSFNRMLFNLLKNGTYLYSI